jgi:SAM-dependent methyltransferase
VQWPAIPFTTAGHTSCCPVTVPRAIYIWGTGQVGRDALRRLGGRSVAAFIDNDSGRWYGEAAGLPVLPPATVLTATTRGFVVIASMYEDEIARQLREAAWMPGVDFASIASLVAAGGDPPAQAFTRIFENNSWSDSESRSGGGSNLEATAAIRGALPDLFRRYGIRSVVDAPCGDLRWMATLLPEIELYTGVDVVPQLVHDNRARYASPRVRFLERDLAAEPPPAADLIICRDCLVHLPTELATSALRNIAATPARYLLTTTFPRTSTNRDVITGAWRPINLELAPFTLGAPIEAIPEYEPGSSDAFADKTLALWPLDDLRAALAHA